MTDCDLDTSVPDWIIEHPETLPVFQELGIDYSCGGKSLEYASRQQGLDPTAVLIKLHQSVEGRRDTAQNQPILLSIQVGRPRELGEEGAEDPMDRPWTTGFFKEPTLGPVWLGRTNLEGDGQADLVHHGGPDKAVLAYSADHYAAWREVLNNPALPFGAFGENFTIEGLKEADVCIGDTWKVGDEATIQLSQPRQPCWKLARRWRIKSLALDVERSGRTGWYFRVLKEGAIVAGMPLTLLERPFPEWSVERANRVMHWEKNDVHQATALAALPLLSASWRSTLTRRAERYLHPDTAKRLEGENGST